MKILRGDILLFKGTNWVSKIVKYSTNSIYSHVGLAYDSNFIIEAQAWHGVRAVDLDKTTAPCDVYRVKKIYQYDIIKVIDYLSDKLGSRYDYLAVLYLGLLKMTGRKPDRNWWNNQYDVYCSELAWEAFNAGGLDITPDVPGPSLTSPDDIAKSIVTEKV